jgi:hypothetical protein
LECRGDRAETDAEEQCGSDQPGEFCDAAEEGHSSGKEEKPRADSVIRALLVKDTSDEGTRHQNRARIACVEEARLCGEPETARIKWDEGKHAAVGKEENACDESGRHCTALNERAYGNRARGSLRQYNRIRQIVHSAGGN